jgi:exodeoxyribonuclease VII large subunit
MQSVPADAFTVSEVSGYIEELFRTDPFLTDLWVKGEVSNFVQASSGHCYFTLKDPGAAMKCVMWRSDAMALRTLPRDGDHVLAHGYVGIYRQRGDYQFYVDYMQPEGAGILYQEFLRIKAKLEAEGLFAAERKRPIPPFPRRLGVVTSPTGAALRDILRILRERYPLTEVILAPAIVQGKEAPASIVNALSALNSLDGLDAIILARGGGSIEDLWAFNDEAVARAVAASRYPVITGVGHETDFTIVDFVSDRRAPTPTGAAAAAVPDRRDLEREIEEIRRRLWDAVERRITESRRKVHQMLAFVMARSPRRAVAYRRQMVDELHERLLLAMKRRLELKRGAVAQVTARLDALDPTAVLRRGYAIVQDAGSGEVIASVSKAVPGRRLDVRVSDGVFGAEVTHG